jgi:drug/metabolite transporter (DMT)-like permease
LTDARIVWGWPTLATLLFVAIGPAVLAYRCWGLGVQRAGPAIAGFFSNLTPLFAALMSAAPFLARCRARTTRWRLR